MDALLCLDKSNLTDGTTPFHEAAKNDNVELLEYLIRIFKKRNEAVSQKMK